MDKKEYIRSLDNVKLVVGNGFDLHCGLKTSYFDYIISRHEKFEKILKWYSDFENCRIFNINGHDDEGLNFNCWDIFFALNLIANKINKNTEWFNIEKLILSSLINESEVKLNFQLASVFMVSAIHWAKVEINVGKMNYALSSLEDFMCQFVKERMDFLKSKTNFYPFLLSELKLFEVNFGNFVDSQIHNKYMERTNYNIQHFLNEKYIKNFEESLEQLCDPLKITSVDTFNYTVVPDNRLSKPIHHINGNFLHPIFGIDSTYFKPSDKRFIFTKTSRRMDNDFNDKDIDLISKSDNLIIYGHSLNEADFNYFFPVFDKLQLLDSDQKGVIVFPYTIYDETKKEEIQSNHLDSISKLFHEYARSKDVKAPERFLDSLTTQGRIIIDEIDLLDFKYSNFLDDDWEKLVVEARPLFNLLNSIKA